MKIKYYLDYTEEGTFAIFDRLNKHFSLSHYSSVDINPGQPIYVFDRLLALTGQEKKRTVQFGVFKYRLMERDASLRGYIAVRVGWLEWYGWLWMLVDKLIRIFELSKYYWRDIKDILSFRI